MVKTNFTPAPWLWVKDRNTDGFYGLYSGVTPVVYPQRCNDGDDGLAWFSADEDYYGETALKQADADLIAAAPDMYKLLANLQIEGGLSIARHREIDRMLAKARGEQ
jgi:hypothetical protein